MTTPTTAIKCDVCGKEQKNGRALALHKRYHCSGQGGGGSGSAAAGQAHVHKFSVLKPDSHPNAPLALAKGFTKICECGWLE